MNKNQHLSLTEGTIWKSMLMFAFPVFLGNVFQQLYNTVDSLIVGRFLGEQALAAVSSSGHLIFMFVGFFNGLAMGAGILIARFYGARDFEKLKQAIHTDVAFGLVTGAVISLLGVVFTPTILGWMGTPEDVMPQAVVYFRYFFCGAIFTIMYNIFVGILHAQGDSRHPLYYLASASILNVLLDLLFVGGFHMGVGSAALATTLSQFLSCVCCVWQMLRQEGPGRLEPRLIRMDLESLKGILRFGVPSGIQNSVIGLANVVVQSNINAFGTAAMAGCGVYSKIEGFAFLPISCFVQTTANFVSQNLGAAHYDRVKKGARFALICSVSMVAVFGLCFYVFAPQLISLFNDSPEVVKMGVMHARVTTPFFALLAFSHCSAGILRGSGKPMAPMVTMLLFWCVLRVSYITVAVRYFPVLTTVSWAYPLTWGCSTVIYAVMLLKGDWVYGFNKEIKMKELARQ